jgi:hypothetical protein
VQGRGGELILMDAKSDDARIISRFHIAAKPADQEAELLTFPAIVGVHLFARCEGELICVDLAG